MTSLKSLQALTDRQLVEMVSVELMGDEPNYCPHEGHPHGNGWNPLKNWNHTMDVVERMYEHWGSRLYLQRRRDGRYDALFTQPVQDLIWATRSERDGRRAICLAALLAVS